MDLIRIWLGLIGLTAVTTALAGWPGLVGTVGLLVVAWLKARAILGGFLGLSRGSGWLAAFTIPLALWLCVIGGLYAL